MRFILLATLLLAGGVNDVVVVDATTTNGRNLRKLNDTNNNLYHNHHETKLVFMNDKELDNDYEEKEETQKMIELFRHAFGDSDYMKEWNDFLVDIQNDEETINIQQQQQGRRKLADRGDSGTTTTVTASRAPRSRRTKFCPAAGEAPVRLNFGINILMTDYEQNLCLLYKVANDGSYIEPVARSTDQGDFVLTGGSFHENLASVDLSTLLRCTNGRCLFRIPFQRGDVPDYVFELHAYTAPTLDDKSTAARFLEQATFGTTFDELDYLTGTLGNNFESWIDNQMNTVPMTSHREYYRKRANPRLEIPISPGTLGPPPCEENARWRSFAFTIKDTGRILTVTSYNGDNAYPYLLSVDGIPRTFSTSFEFTGGTPSIPGDGLFGTPMEICDEQRPDEESVGRTLAVSIAGGACVEIVGGNPPIDLSVDESYFADYIMDFGTDAGGLLAPVDDTVYVDRPWFTEFQAGDEYILTSDVATVTCDTLVGDLGWGPFIKVTIDATLTYLVYDVHLILNENTVENPLPDGGGATTIATNGNTECANVPRNFLNEEHCFMSSDENTCSAASPPSFTVTLDDSSIIGLYTTTGRYVYAIDNLPLVDVSGSHTTYLDLPCDNGRNHISRWQLVDNSNCNNGADTTYRTVAELSETSLTGLLFQNYDPSDTTRNSELLDIELEDFTRCDNADEDKYDLGFIYDSDNSLCWQHVHPLHMNVYDLTEWAQPMVHPGGDTKIKMWAEGGSAVLIFPPDPHDNERFYESIVNNPNTYPFLGTYGDSIPYYDLPSNLQNTAFEIEFGEFTANPTGQGVLVCGSVGEVANDPTMGTNYDINNYVTFANGESVEIDTTAGAISRRQRTSIWGSIVLSADDQLRQRVAWALSQILVVAPNTFSDRRNTEAYLSYYDIFVRHAFGSYRDILKQISYHDNMGEMLSSISNRSFQYNLDRFGIKAFPDENFAREIMQLFSIGLFTLNADGTPVYENGVKVEVYDNDDILAGARAWTGFERLQRRGNVENRVPKTDPMNVRSDWRDPIPKYLLGGFIGDRYPLCIDQPEQQFLKKGAVYRLMGSAGRPELQSESNRWEGNPLAIRLELSESDELYTALCGAATPSGPCVFAPKITLDTNLACGSLCDLDTVRTVKIQSSPIPVFYEYVRPACVEQAFYENAKRINDNVFTSYEAEYLMCADPRRDIAAEACCVDGWEAMLTAAPEDLNTVMRQVGWGYRYCRYNGERMTYDRAIERCQANSQEQCRYARIRDTEGGVCALDIRDNSYFHWTDAPCSVMVKVASDGTIAIVHDPEPDYTGVKNVRGLVSEDNENYFVTPWTNDYPTVANGCASLAACTEVDGTCLCTTTVVEETAFTSTPGLASILSDLFIGAVHPDQSDLSYTMLSCSGIEVYVTGGGSCSSLDETTIFHVTDDNGVDLWLKNMKSNVQVEGASQYEFRNPVHFISLVDIEKRDTYYEIDAVIDQYFYHPNHPPFLAIRMIQRFGISNPTPSYVLAVATAYRAGTYTSNGMSFGQGKYGDMGAMVAAILLHDEARSTALDADPTYGSLKEPLLKVVGYMRNMKYKHYAPPSVSFLSGLQGNIGQGAYEVRSVFSFFLPEYSPPGVLGAAGLVSPEAQVLTSSKVANLVDGLFWLTKFGLNHCNGDGSLNTYNYRGLCSAAKIDGDYTSSIGHLEYTPSADVTSAATLVDELALVMTSSRLSAEARTIIINAITTEYGSDIPLAVRIAQQLIITTPEFHSTTLVRPTTTLRPEVVPGALDNVPYKAVVFLYFQGGMDSFNLIVPHSDCGSKDLFAEYQEVRGARAMNEANLIDITTVGDYRNGDQPCGTFGVNDAIPYLAQLYNEGDALFFANTGVLQKPVSKQTWEAETQSPLFAHNSQQVEAWMVDIQDVQGRAGILGRMLDTLKVNGFQTGATTIDDAALAVTGIAEYSNPVTELSSGNPREFGRFPSSDSVLEKLYELNTLTEPDSSLFGETWSSTLVQAVADNEQIVSINDNSSFEPTTTFPDTSTGRSLRAAARWIKAREHRVVTRDAIYVSQGGYDHHAVSDTSNLELNLAEANDAIEAFVNELKAQGLWNDVVIVTASDFGRTLTPNSGEGSDHAWGGNYVMMGGGLNGGRILGEYPLDLTAEGELNIGRGRVIPTTPWDGIWLGVCQFMGVTDSDDLNFVLPNRNAFDSCSLYPDSVLFTGGTDPWTCSRR